MLEPVIDAPVVRLVSRLIATFCTCTRACALWGLTRNLRKPRNTAKCLPTPSLQSRVDQFDHHIDGEAVGEHDRLGAAEAIMLAHGFSIDMMVELINSGLQRRRWKAF